MHAQQHYKAQSTDYHLVYVEELFNINSVTSMNTLLTRNEIDCGLEPNTTVPEYTQPPVPCHGRASTPLAPGRPSLWRRNARHGRLWLACSRGDIGAPGRARGREWHELAAFWLALTEATGFGSTMT